MPDNDLVPVMVPREHLTDVYAYIAQLEGQRTQVGTNSMSTGDAAASFGVRAAGDRWTEAKLEGIAMEMRSTVRRTAKLMDVLSGSAGKKVPMTELAAEAGLTRGELQGALSGFARWVRSTFGHRELPYGVELSSPTASDLTAESYYWMDSVTASRWETVRGRGSQ